MRQQTEYTIFNNSSKLKAAFTAAVTDIITSNSHGLVDGDLVQLTTTTTLPAGLSTATNYYVIEATTNTFKLSAILGGVTAVNITDTGSGTHSFNLKGKTISIQDYKVVVLAFNTAASAAFVIKVQGSSAQTAPDFNAAASATNRWDYVQSVDLNSGSGVAGDTGITLTGTDDNRLLEANINGLNYLTVEVSSWTVGTMNLKAQIYDNQ